MSANVRETKSAFGFKKQSGVQTANVAADLWSLSLINDQLTKLEINSEDDAKWLGKGNEFAQNVYLSHWNVSRTIDKYITSQFMAHLAVFGLGAFTKTSPVAGAYQYVCTPQDPVVGGIDTKNFTWVEAIRQGGSAVFDRAFIGCAWEDFTVSLNSGPGLQNSKVTANFVGTGLYTEPSTLTIPAVTTEHFMNGSSLAITVNGVDYVTNRNLISAEFGWKQNIRLDSGFFPGSGTQVAGDGSSGAVRGRMEYGDRALTFRFVARFDHGSPELATLRAQTEGTASLGLTGPLISGTTHHSMLAQFQRIRFKTAEVSNTDGIVSIAVDVSPLYDSVNGVFTLTVVTDKDNIGA